MEKTVNRVLQAWKTWEERQAEMEKTVGSGKEHTSIIRQLKLEHFLKCRNLLSNNLRKDEQPFLPLMNHAIGKLEREVRPNLFLRLLFRLKNTLVDKPAQVKEHERCSQENMEALKRQLVKAGFSDFAGRLDQHLDTFQPKHEIILSSQLSQQRALHVNLQFEKDASGLFHFAAATTSIKNRQEEIERSFVFKINEWPDLHVQQVKNLLEGRAVKQDFTDISGRRTSQWMELPENGNVAKKYNENYGFNLGDLLEQDQFKSLVFTNGKSSLIEHLESGYQGAAKWSHAGGYETVFLKAEPSAGTIKFYDSSQKAITPELLNKKLESQKEKQQAVIKQMQQVPSIGKRRKKNLSAGV
jgi:hypothetical protein